MGTRSRARFFLPALKRCAHAIAMAVITMAGAYSQADAASGGFELINRLPDWDEAFGNDVTVANPGPVTIAIDPTFSSGGTLLQIPAWIKRIKVSIGGKPFYPFGSGNPDPTMTRSGSSTRVSSNPHIVGYIDNGEGTPYHAFRFDMQTSALLDLQTLNPANHAGTSSFAQGLNNNGSVVVGFSGTLSGFDHAFRWTSSGGMWDPLESTCRHASLSIL